MPLPALAKVTKGNCCVVSNAVITFPSGVNVRLHAEAGASYDVVFDLSRAVQEGLASAATLSEETVGWPYHHDLDLTGFIDGTENPKGRERAGVALIGAEDREFAGGSYVFTQRYVHDLGRWRKTPLAEQEAFLGDTQIVLLAITAVVGALTVLPGRATVQEGAIHLVLVAAFLFLAIRP